ncbi:hypothetical protein JX265_008350 [Neoarthrinium moseri]|uniref:EamA domain-containing protein n=1 Tax=Neoarthrinium moseri TaxID=1658444 RepID=A0A9P9WI42_9PEZI|nr:hypothetical protein JX265_008350 [Neoarthrinium moseri]
MAPHAITNLTELEYSTTPAQSDDKERQPLSPVEEEDSMSEYGDLPISSMELNYLDHPATWRLWLQETWAQNKGVLLVFLSMFFAASMDLAVRMLETDRMHPIHAMPILFLRHVMTAVCIVAYGYLMRSVPDHPFGTHQLRGILIIRGTAGFIAVSGIYFSLLYLPLAEATVLTFLAPIVTCYAINNIFRDEAFSLMQQLACVISFLGVVLVAMNSSDEDIWRHRADAQYDRAGVLKVHKVETRPILNHARMLGIIAALLGVVGQAGGMVTIRMIGPRVHPLISMNYSSLASIVFCGLGLLLLPGVPFTLPATPLQWILLFVVTGCGFLFQLLLTEGLSYGAGLKGTGGTGYSYPPAPDENKPNGPPKKVGVNRAVGMMYTQLLFALVYDWSVFYHAPSLYSWAGIVLIVTGAIWVIICSS